MDAAPTPGGGGASAILTGGASVEVVVILGDVRQDAEAVGDLKSHHVFCVQQGRNSQLLLRNTEGLEMTHIRVPSTQTASIYCSQTLGEHDRGIRAPDKWLGEI